MRRSKYSLMLLASPAFFALPKSKNAIQLIVKELDQDTYRNL